MTEPEREPNRTGRCWFCRREVPYDSLIAGYDTFEEQRLACNTCNDAIRWMNDHGFVFSRSAEAAAPAGLPKYVAFVKRAADVMVKRLEHGRAKFGVDWDEAHYSDQRNEARIRRAVDHLVAARTNSPDPAEWQKRAADVANQAFMYADPERDR